MGYMRDKIGDAAMLEQLAEECAELGKAALKMARVLRKENPTPVTKEQARQDLIEEYTDVLLCADEFGLMWDEDIATAKRERFKARWEEAHEASYIRKHVREMPGMDVSQVMQVTNWFDRDEQPHCNGCPCWHDPCNGNLPMAFRRIEAKMDEETR